MVYAVVALSLNILTGMAGQISIGHAGFWALGAYASAIAMTKFGVPFVIAIFVGGAVAGVFGALVALPALRVAGHYLAIATLAFAILVQQVLFEWESVTGGRQGLAVPRPSLRRLRAAERLLVLLLPARAVPGAGVDDTQSAHLVHRHARWWRCG